MTTATVSIPGRYQMPPLPVRRFTVDEYHRLIEHGYFAADERFQLVEGWIVPKLPRNPPHDAYLAHSRRVLDRILPPGWHVRVQSAVTLSDSEPEPDMAVVRGEELDYVARHPGPSDVALVVEVANTTLGADRGIMQRVYARAGIIVYWIINLPDRQVEVYTDPSGPDASPAYRRRELFGISQLIPLEIGGSSCGPLPAGELLR